MDISTNASLAAGSISRQPTCTYWHSRHHKARQRTSCCFACCLLLLDKNSRENPDNTSSSTPINWEIGIDRQCGNAMRHRSPQPTAKSSSSSQRASPGPDCVNPVEMTPKKGLNTTQSSFGLLHRRPGILQPSATNWAGPAEKHGRREHEPSHRQGRHIHACFFLELV